MSSLEKCRYILLIEYAPWGRKQRKMRLVRKKGVKRRAEMCSGTMVAEFQLVAEANQAILSCRVWNFRVDGFWESLSLYSITDGEMGREIFEFHLFRKQTPSTLQDSCEK